MDPAVRFWLLVLATAGTLSGSPCSSSRRFCPVRSSARPTYGYVLSIFVALASLGLLVRSLSADGDGVTGGSPGTR